MSQFCTRVVIHDSLCRQLPARRLQLKQLQQGLPHLQKKYILNSVPTEDRDFPIPLFKHSRFSKFANSQRGGVIKTSPSYQFNTDDLLRRLGHEEGLPDAVDDEAHLARGLGHQVSLDVGQHQEQDLGLLDTERLGGHYKWSVLYIMYW